VAPPFRHTHFDGKQVVVHNRKEGLHELFSYNLYPGPSAKKGVYGMLLNIGEEERWVTMHCSTVQVITPYENKVVISHEGASGGGKSEMLEYAHRQGTARCCSAANTGQRREAQPDPAPGLRAAPGHRRHGPLPSLAGAGNGKLT
jgi:hypothetical protein